MSKNFRSMILLGAACLLSSQAHAYMDYGTTNGASGVVDGRTNLTWAVGDTADAGAANGFRPATTDEFRAFLTDTGWVHAAGAGEQFSLQDGSGAKVTTNPSIRFAFMNSLHGYGPITPESGEMSPYLYGGAARLDGGTSGQAGFLVAQWNHSALTNGPVWYTNAALIGNLDQAKLKTYDTSAILWSNLVLNSGPLYGGNPSQDDPGAWMYHSGLAGYFLVASSVPEPQAWAMMGLGLAGIALSVRRKGKCA